MAVDIEQLKASVTGEVDARRQQLKELSLKIHSNPELGFSEVKASAWLTHYTVLLWSGVFVNYRLLSGRVMDRVNQLSPLWRSTMPYLGSVMPVVII
jgi:hypothetical protein